MASEPGPITGGPRRHPAQVTADRLADHTETYADQLTPNEQTAMASAVRALTSIAAGERP